MLVYVTYLNFLERKSNMSKINSAIYEIHHMDSLAARNQWVNRIHPLVKLIITVFYIAVVVSFSKYNIAGLTGMIIYPVVIFQLGDLSFKDTIRKLRFVLPLVCFLGIFNPFFDRRIVTNIGGLPITTGILSMLTLMMKGVFSVLASYLLIATTSIEKLCYAMRLLHIPAIIVTQVLLTYRYITVLLEEANRITQSYTLRAPNQKGVHFKVWGTLTGQLLLRSMDRAERLYESMSLRGYAGEFYYGDKVPCKGKDYVYLFLWMGLLILLKYIPVITIAGNLFL